MNLPDFVRIRQKFKTRPIADIAQAVRLELSRIKIGEIIAPGQRVAVTAGSRGIVDLGKALAALVATLKEIGAEPFIIPAMGSHGGATAQGQKKVLAHLGVTEESIGAPIVSSMKVVKVAMTPQGIDVYLDKHASRADHIVVVNRIKPHTDFQGDIESGLFKMMAIGMGKQKGADYYHNVIVRSGHYPVFLAVAREVLKHCRIACGLALVENQRDETEIIRAMPAAEIEETERLLLKRAKDMFPRIPLSPIDLLIVDWMGKEISGAGMDQNIIGRTVIPYHHPSRTTQVMRIFVRDLTDESGGNAIGIGNADVTTKRLVDKTDQQATYINAFTSSCPEAARIPPYFTSDGEAIEAILKTIGQVDPREARIVHIRNTSMLEEFNISEAMVPEARGSAELQIIGPPSQMAFDNAGNLLSDV